MTPLGYLIFSVREPDNIRVDTRGRVKLGMKIFSTGSAVNIARYLGEVRREDPIALGILEAWMALIKAQNHKAIRKGRSLLQAISGKPVPALFLFRILGMAYKMAGEIETAQNYFLRALELAEQAGDKESESLIKG